MSDPDDIAAPEPSEVAENQLAALGRYEHYRRTWELELLISGAVVFAFMKVPGLLEDEVEPIPRQSFKATARFYLRPPDGAVDAALDCLGSFHRVYLNDELSNLEYDFFTRASTGVRGIVAYLPVDGLPRSRNALRIEQVKIEDNEEEPGDEDAEKRVVYFIPFWL